MMEVSLVTRRNLLLVKFCVTYLKTYWYRKKTHFMDIARINNYSLSIPWDNHFNEIYQCVKPYSID
jgi:hypothetical protein